MRMIFIASANKMVKHSGTKELFSDFMKQEVGHRKSLRSCTGKVAVAKIEKVPNLKISDYMVEEECGQISPTRISSE